MDDLTFGEKLKRALNTNDAEELLRLCCDSSKRKDILDFEDDAGHCLLHRVSGSGTVDVMRTLMNMGADENEDVCNEFETWLQTACSHGNTDVVNFFLRTDEGLKDEASQIEYNDCFQLFYFAAKSGNIETIKDLQKNSQLDINQVFSDGRTALLMLVKNNDPKGVDILCQCGADVNVGTFYRSGFKAIHIAARGFRDCAEMIQILLKYGANVNEPLIRNNLNQQPLFMALKAGNERNARVLFEHGADISFKGETSETPEDTIGCFCLAIKQCPALVPDFIKRGANLYERHNKKSVLMIALDSNAGSVAIEALVKAGANLKFGRDGKNVIQCCKHYDQLKSFRNAGISVHEMESTYKVPTLGLALSTWFSYNICTVGRSDLEIENGELELIKNEVADLVLNGANPDMSTEECDLPLITAVKNRLQGVFEILIAAGANIHQLGKDGNSAVHVCCIESNWSFLEILLTTDIDLNKANAKGNYPLELAIRGRQYARLYMHTGFERFNTAYVNKTIVSEEIITKMLNKGANPNLTESGKNSPLILAILKRLDKIVEVLLHAGADASHIGEKKSTTFESCFKPGPNPKSIDTLKILIENGMPLNKPNSGGKYPLELLIDKNRDCTYFLLLLSNGADPNIIAKGNSVLMKTVKLGMYDVCIALLDANADIGRTDEDGFTAFDILTSQLKELSSLYHPRKYQGSAVKLFETFVLAGIDVNQQNMFGTYPLFLAISLGAEGVVKVILEKGADVNIVNDNGKTPLFESIFHELDDIVKVLLHAGANVNQICNAKTEHHAGNGRVYTSLDHCVLKSMEDISEQQTEMSILAKLLDNKQMSLEKRRYFVSLLLEFGADPNLEKYGKDSCLMLAVHHGDPTMVKTLLEAHADINHIGNKGYTALHVFFLNINKSVNASYRTILEGAYIDESFEDESSVPESGTPSNVSFILKILLEYGAHTDVSSLDGNLPIHIALSNCKTCYDFESNLGDIMKLIDLTKDINIPDKNRSTPFLDITKFCSLDVMKKMVELGADLKSKGTNGKTALHVVIEKKMFSRDIFSFLLINGADINAINDLEETPLISCIKRGSTYASVENIVFLLENGAKANLCADESNSALLDAILFESFNVASVLIDHQANLNHIGENGNTVLHAVFSKEYRRTIHHYSYVDDNTLCNSDDDTKYAGFKHLDRSSKSDVGKMNRDTNITSVVGVKKRHGKKFLETLEVVEKLVDAGACLNIANKDGKTPLCCLIENQSKETIETVLPYLLETGSDPNFGEALPLIAAAYLNQQRTTTMLLEHGANVDGMNSQGNTALTTILNDYCDSTKGSREGIVDILLKGGASVTLTDGNGKPPLLLLINSVKQSGNYCYGYTNWDKLVSQTALKLIDKGANPKATPFGEDSALNLAVENMLSTVVKMLLELGADIHHLGKNGQNVLHCYFRLNVSEIYQNYYGGSKSLEILELLLSKYSNVNLQDDEGATPLHMAITNQNIEGVKKLLSARSDILLQGKDGLNAFELCLKFGTNRNDCLKILDVLTDHAPLDKTADVFFSKFWEYIKSNDSVHAVGNKQTLDSVTCKILNTKEDVNVNLANTFDDSPLIYFCRLGCLQSIRMLLVHKADVDHQGKRRMTALHHITYLTDYEHAALIFECLLGASPRLDICDDLNQTVMKRTIDMLCGKRAGYWNSEYYYDPSMSLYHVYDKHKYFSKYVQKMLKVGAKTDQNDLNNALIMCAQMSDFTGIICLIRYGGDYCKKDGNGKSILHLCWSNPLDGALEFLQNFVDTGHSLISIDSVKNSILMSLLSEVTRACRYQERDETIAHIVSFLIQNGAYIVKNKDGNGPLHLAAMNGYLATIKVLLQLGKDSIFDNNNAGDTAIHICLKNPKANVCKIIEKMLENQTSNLCLNSNGESPLYLATAVWLRQLSDVSSLTSRLVTSLLEYGANPNDHTQNQIPLLSAIEANDIQTATLLLKAGANINATNHKGMSALHTIFVPQSQKENYLRLTQLLFENEINVNLVDTDGKSALFYLFEKYNGNYHTDSDVKIFKDIFNGFFKHGADLNICDNLQETVLSSFCSSGKVVDIAEVLLENGADPKFGYCIQHSLRNCRSFYENADSWISFIHSLLLKGADPNKHKTDGSNLIDCVQYQNSYLVEEIILFGADINFADGMKKTALHYACIRGQVRDRHEITALLVKHGSNLNATSTNGEKPLDVLVQNMIKNMRNIDVKEAKEEQCGLLTIDLSLLNLLVRGGADLCPSMLDTIDAKIGELSTETMQIPDKNTSRSALFMLISNGLFKTAEYLLHSGWDVEKEEWFDAFDVSKLDLENVTVECNIHKRYENETRKAEFQSFLESIDTGPKSLTNICRNAIRHQLSTVSNGSEIETKISALPLPSKIKCFLSLKEFMNDIENIVIEKMVLDRVARYDSDDYYGDYYDDSDSDDDYYYGCYEDSYDVYYDSDW